MGSPPVAADAAAAAALPAATAAATDVELAAAKHTGDQLSDLALASRTERHHAALLHLMAALKPVRALKCSWHCSFAV